MSLTNLELAELLARESEAQEGNKQKAARRASRVALSWPEEVTDILGRGDRLTDLPAVGPWVAVLIHDWLEDPPEDIEPASELREDFQTYAGALSLLATDPVWQEELRGDLQMHTTYSDGALGVEELARHAIHLGYEYVAITDHSKGLKIAGGMEEAVMALQWD